MRLLLPSTALALTLAIPGLAEASPFSVQLTPGDVHQLTHAPQLQSWFAEPPPPDAEAGADASADPEAGAADAAGEAGESAEGVEGPSEAPADDPVGGDPVDIEGEDEDDEFEEQTGPVKKGDFNANAIGVSGGIHLIPSYFLNKALASYANSVCRNEVGNWGEENGLVKVDGCNFYVNGGYTRRISRAFDISVNLGYLNITPPDALWIDNGEWDRDSCTVNEGPGSSCDLTAADYTEIDLRMFTVEVNFIGRGTLYRNEDVEIQLGGGGGVGIGVLVGDGISRTPLGGPEVGPDCNTLSDTADFRKCTPRYYDDPGTDQDGDGNASDISRQDVDDNGGMAPGGLISTGTTFASCSRDKCRGGDLDAFGSRQTGGTWPVYPLINVLGSFRIIVKDTFGINIEGGIKDGFFFGGGIQYFFGGGGKDKPAA
ncbi:hypothetical protein G6O69_08870 [Pseudenhygromyxa sp. WMMC2535]|uniref:hypothetical protein n=1 Tax=Pseudenhygromyxa sp. WMMC2535 TaxID=2712867 RepID=UPI0015532A4C|nr:hypothetical protein [Pseudenhygromyxa sp. WMMC2535]NVB37946.1 hypothetical protein [Pseudenhygromyxa sp. WMMC2535]